MPRAVVQSVPARAEQPHGGAGVAVPLGDPLGEVLPLPAGAAVVREARICVEEEEEDGEDREDGESREDGEDSSSCGQRRREADARVGAKL